MKKLFYFLIVCSLLFAFKKKEIKWVAIGDSITYLNDHANETGNRVSKGYLTRVVEKLENVHYINKGYNGWTSGGIAEKFKTLLIEPADVYTIFLGTNDWWSGRPLGSFTDYKNNTGNSSINGSFRIIIDKLKALNKNAKIILITPMKRVDFVYLNNMKNNAYGSYRQKTGQTLEQVALAIRTIGAYEGFFVLDLFHEKKLDYPGLVKFKRLKDPSTGLYKDFKYPLFINITFNPLADEYPYPVAAIGYTYDGLHPSDKGNAVIAKKLIKILKKM